MATSRVLLAAQAEVERLASQVQFHQERLERARAELRQVERTIGELGELVQARRRAIEERWAARRTLRQMLGVVAELRPFTLPQRAGAVRSLLMARKAELASELRQKAAAVHHSLGQSGVYALFDGEELVYVGQAENVLLRVGQHLRSKRFSHAAYISAPANQLNQLERALLDVYAPRLKQGLSHRRA